MNKYKKAGLLLLLIVSGVSLLVSLFAFGAIGVIWHDKYWTNSYPIWQSGHERLIIGQVYTMLISFMVFFITYKFRNWWLTINKQINPENKTTSIPKYKKAILILLLSVSGFFLLLGLFLFSTTLYDHYWLDGYLMKEGDFEALMIIQIYMILVSAIVFSISYRWLKK